MSRSKPVSRTTFLPARLLVAGLCSLAALSTGDLWAQSTSAPAGTAITLPQAFAAAWARQPEAQSLDLRREAAEARRQVADSWTAQPPSLDLAGKTDQLSKNQGSREYAAGVVLPLWLPGERSGQGDRYADGSPVKDAKLELELGGVKVPVEPHAEGEFEATLAQELKPGVVSVAATVIAGEETDLLAGELDVHEEAHDETTAHTHGWKEYALWAGAAGGALLLLAALLRRLRASRNPRFGGAA